MKIRVLAIVGLLAMSSFAASAKTSDRRLLERFFGENASTAPEPASPESAPAPLPIALSAKNSPDCVPYGPGLGIGRWECTGGSASQGGHPNPHLYRSLDCRTRQEAVNDLLKSCRGCTVRPQDCHIVTQDG